MKKHNRRTDAQTKKLIAHHEYLKALLAEFGLKLAGWDPGVLAIRPIPDCCSKYGEVVFVSLEFTSDLLDAMLGEANGEPPEEVRGMIETLAGPRQFSDGRLHTGIERIARLAYRCGKEESRRDAAIVRAALAAAVERVAEISEKRACSVPYGAAGVARQVGRDTSSAIRALSTDERVEKILKGVKT